MIWLSRKSRCLHELRGRICRPFESIHTVAVGSGRAKLASGCVCLAWLSRQMDKEPESMQHV